MTASWSVMDEHLIISWTEIGGIVGFQPEWITKFPPEEEGQPHTSGVAMSMPSLFGGAKWYSHELWERPVTSRDFSANAQ